MINSSCGRFTVRGLFPGFPYKEPVIKSTYSTLEGLLKSILKVISSLSLLLEFLCVGMFLRKEVGGQERTGYNLCICKSELRLSLRKNICFWDSICAKKRVVLELH